MRNLSYIVVEDIWMNTMAGTDVADKKEPAVPTDPYGTPTWNEVEEANIVLNPDVDSQDWRG
jgi:hypothetical protein